MDLLNGNLKKLYFKYLSAAFGSTLIMSVYSLVDTIVVGQYEGAAGSSAIVTFTPMWSLLFAVGLLFGIGGAVLMAHRRGGGDIREGNVFFTVSLICALIVSAVIFVVYNLFAEPLLSFCGARDEVLVLALRYARHISLASPLFVIGQVLVPFIRNDGAPFRTTVAVLAGGVFNIFGDIFFVFGLDMGISGAGLATALGQVITFGILLTHFFSKRCGLRLVRLRINKFFGALGGVFKTGVSSFVIDIAMGVLTIMFNNQILAYFGSAALAVYSVLSNTTVMLQTLSYAVGESSQAIISINYGAGLGGRVKTTFKYASVTALCLSLLWYLLVTIFPDLIIRLFMDATPEVLAIAPSIMRRYALSFLLLGFNVNASYYFQSVEKASVSLLISLLRGIVLGAVFIYALPAVFGGDAIWFATPLSELLVFVLIIVDIARHGLIASLPGKEKAV